MSMTPEERKAMEADRRRRYYQANKEKEAERNHLYNQSNKEKLNELSRRRRRRKGFTQEDGSSFQEWLASLVQPEKTFEAIANLTPDPGQTLAELIHELSGYAMEVCEQIANPQVIEESPALTPPPAEDLF